MELSSDNDFIDDKLQTSSSNMDYSTSMLVVDDVKILKVSFLFSTILSFSV